MKKSSRVVEMLLRFKSASDLHPQIADDIMQATRKLVEELTQTSNILPEIRPWGEDQPNFYLWICVIDPVAHARTGLVSVIREHAEECMAQFVDEDEIVRCTVSVLQGESSMRNGTKIHP